MEQIAYIEFRKSRSKKFDQVLALTKRMPNYSEVDSKYSFVITEIKQYFQNQENIKTIIECIHNWKEANIYLLGKQYKSQFDFYDFIDSMKEISGKYGILLEYYKDDVSLGAITMESLPLPIVLYPPLYGSFFAFAEDIGEDVYFCECERKAIENHIRLKYLSDEGTYVESENYPLDREFPPVVVGESYDWFGNPESHIRYKEGICFRCNKVIPQKIYCHPMYGGKFKQHYGWFINQEYFNLGVEKNCWGKIKVIPDQCSSPQLYDTVMRVNALLDEDDTVEFTTNSTAKLRTYINKVIENMVREQFGVKKIGDAWVSETILFQIVEGLYPEEKIRRHYRPKWLEGLELDIYIPGNNLGIEYQGIQHFKAIDHWGGQKQLEKQKEHDIRKKRLCEERGVRFICINYDEPLTTEYIKHRLGM